MERSSLPNLATLPGPDVALNDPSVRASAHGSIDPPWTRFEPLRIGGTPTGLGTPEMYVCVDSDIGRVLRLDVYDRHGRREAIAWAGRVFIGSWRTITCIEPYSRGATEIELATPFDHFHFVAGLLLAVSVAHVARLDPGGSVLWQSATVGGGAIELGGVTSDGEVTGVGVWEDWDGEIIERRPFRLDLATGFLL